MSKNDSNAGCAPYGVMLGKQIYQQGRKMKKSLILMLSLMVASCGDSDDEDSSSSIVGHLFTPQFNVQRHIFSNQTVLLVQPL